MAAGYQGYFMGGLAKGLQSGVNMGIQLTQLRWQKKKQKELDDLNAKMNDTWNSIGQELISLANDGQLSDDDLLKINTMTIAAPYEMQGIMQNLRTSLSQFKTKDFDNQMEYVKTFYEYGQGLNVKDIDSLYETVRNYITDPHALTLFEVADKRLRHEAEEIDISGELTIGKALPEEYRYPYFKEKGIVGEITPTEKPVTPKKPAISNYTSAVNYLKNFSKTTTSPETFNKVKAGLQNQFPDIDISDITQESLREPEKVAGKEKERVTSLPQLESYRIKILEADTLEESQRLYDSYAKEYNEEDLKINLPKDWTDVKQGDLMDLMSVLNEITAGTSNVKGNKKFAFEINGKTMEKTGEEWYKEIYESYTALLKLLEKQGVDTSQYKKLKPLSEIKKAGRLKGMFTGGGVEIGDLISIYY